MNSSKNIDKLSRVSFSVDRRRYKRQREELQCDEYNILMLIRDAKHKITVQFRLSKLCLIPKIP